MLRFKMRALMNTLSIVAQKSTVLDFEFTAKPTVLHDCQVLIALFNRTFLESENTVLLKGDDEPIYLPANEKVNTHRIIFAHGFFASALHEIAHWCLAGKERRLLEDYGYWYCPDGRTVEQQAEFEQVEVRPQAIEWAFSVACAATFRVSTDNLNGAPVDSLSFTQKVRAQVLHYIENGFPPRAQIFIDALQHYFHTHPLKQADFDDK